VAVVMVTHDDRLAKQAGRILLIEDGGIWTVSDDYRDELALFDTTL
jgi:ABC-type lipoprotein export system ATPase subunit